MATTPNPVSTSPHGRPGRKSRYSKAERQQLVERAMLRLADGVSLRESAAAIGVSYETFRRWRLELSGSSRLRPVKARAGGSPPSRATASEEGHAKEPSLALVTAAGHRVEGLVLAQLVELLRGLG